MAAAKAADKKEQICPLSFCNRYIPLAYAPCTGGETEEGIKQFAKQPRQRWGSDYVI